MVMSKSEHKRQSPAFAARNVEVCNCIIQSWQQYEGELLHFLQGQLDTPDDAADLHQELFVKLLKQGEQFCVVRAPRAWLYRVARNALTDRRRVHKSFVALPPDLPETRAERTAIEQLDACLWRNLGELSPGDRAIVEQCDLQGMGQSEFARQNGLSLVAAKARLQRARKKLRAAIVHNCQVRFDETGQVCCHVPR